MKTIIEYLGSVIMSQWQQMPVLPTVLDYILSPRQPLPGVVMPTNAEQLSEYELKRLENIKENQKLLGEVRVGSKVITALGKF